MPRRSPSSTSERQQGEEEEEEEWGPHTHTHTHDARETKGTRGCAWFAGRSARAEEGGGKGYGRKDWFVLSAGEEGHLGGEGGETRTFSSPPLPPPPLAKSFFSHSFSSVQIVLLGVNCLCQDPVPWGYFLGGNPILRLLLLACLSEKRTLFVRRIL